MVLEVVTHPSPVLREKSKKVCTFDASFNQFISDMFDTMEAYQTDLLTNYIMPT